VSCCGARKSSTMMSGSTEELDSPTILDFIEQLDNDLVDNNLNHSKTQLRAQAL
jgi:hypothetical protein